MNVHKNARLTVAGRGLLVFRVSDGWTVESAAATAGISRRTAHKWLERHRRGGTPTNWTIGMESKRGLVARVGAWMLDREAVCRSVPRVINAALRRSGNWWVPKIPPLLAVAVLDSLRHKDTQPSVVALGTLLEPLDGIPSVRIRAIAS